MRVLVDTNILISAALFPRSVPSQAYAKAVTVPNYGVVCDQNIDEMRAVFNRKFPDRIADMERFLAHALIALTTISTPTDAADSEDQIRDVKDRPILRAAIAAGVDAIVTGDKDFLCSTIEHPRIFSAAQFLADAPKDNISE